MPHHLTALDLFAGSGWGVACQRLGIDEHGVEIMPEAVATRDAAGMKTVFRDVWEGLADPSLVPAYDLLIASPPCQTFSMAGSGSGRRALDDVLGLIDSGEWAYYGTRLRDAAAKAGLDDRTALVLTPLAYIYRHRPTFVALEQVPTVLPVWEAVGEVLRGLGYSVAVGVLSAERYGVPQTRKRAILVARRDGQEARLPAPTHSAYYSRDPKRLDEGVLPWVSMADALGRDGKRVRDEVATWPQSDRPATVIQGDPRVPLRKHHSPESPQMDGALRLTSEEAAVLQSYPADFPFQGRQGKRFLQIGNAVPPLLAEAVLRAITA